ncbi:putative flavoprotein [Talaromyces proteolyticus]|uniref:Flavoprotein n=1 Tax=Talaromyces proteolyticus TaxID=1131652 RepID=A0AAD4Q693_9EURO|nr:putative flavoprotein [Talaromyces proteolyticus]KAH8705461.1 putative flavoprotein [Talaromyces proteolyticus]
MSQTTTGLDGGSSVDDGLTSTQHDGRMHLLLGATGSVATIKIGNIISALAPHVHKSKLSIRVILTTNAQHFLRGQSTEQPTVASLRSLPGVEAVYDDSDEWGPEPWRRGSDILHISLRRWADIFVIAPLSANTLAKLANGFSDNLLTSVCRAWDTDGQVDGKRKRILIACAMNTAMWRHPVTAKHLSVLEKDWGAMKNESTGEETGWYEVLQPQATKILACGDVGIGAMMEWTEIVKIIENRLGLSDN